MEREREQMRENVTGDLIRRYLEVLDDLERALKNRPQDGEGAAWAEGIELIYRKLAGILESEGVELLEAEGQPFDPNLHEAISQEPSDDHESGHVIEVVKNGYRLGDRVLRPAMVRVAQ
jgi:molecular chaperone GrpE